MISISLKTSDGCSILFARYKKCSKISKHSLNDSIVFKCVSQYNPIFLFSSHCSRLFLLSKSLVHILIYAALIQSITVLPAGLDDGQCYKSVPARQSVCFILTFLLFTLFLSLLMLFEDCQPSDPPDSLALYLHLRAYHGKEFYFYTYPDWEVDINKRISQLIPSQCQCQIREIRN